MKKAFLIFLAIVGLLYAAQADCGVSGQTIIVNNELDLEVFEGCDSIFGNLTVEDPNLTYLSALSDLEYIEGTLTILGCTSLFDVDALNNLEFVGGDLIFQVVFTLQNIDGLSNLTHVGGDIIFDTVISIPNVDGLSGIEIVNGDLLFIENHVLTDINGLNNILSIQGDLYLGSLNNILSDVSGLSNVTSVGGDFYLNLPGVTNLADFNSLESIGGDFTIESCDVLASITGFNSLNSVSESILIQENPIMVNTDGFDSLMFVGADLEVVNNPSFFSCCGLYTILNQGQIIGSTILQGNASGCNSNEDVIENCTVGVNQYRTNIFVTKRIKAGGIELIFNSISEEKNIRVYSMMGQLVYESFTISDNSVFIPLSQKSIYLIDIRQNGTRKIIKTNF